jgi:hypothetical protein
MIVNHQYRYVFLHIPKTGGSSIEAALGLREQEDGAEKPPKDVRAFHPGYKWLDTSPDTYERIGRTKHHIKEDRIPDGYFVFSFVRNPWDRILSYYLFRNHEPRALQRKNPIKKKETKMDFTSWLKTLERLRAKRKHVDFLAATAPQYETLGDLPDFVGKLENLENDFAFICRKIGFEPKELLNVNPTTVKNKHYSLYYDDESIDLVASRYAVDIEQYGYHFETTVGS